MSLPSSPKRCCDCNKFGKCKRADFCTCRKNGTACTSCHPSNFHSCTNAHPNSIYHPSPPFDWTNHKPTQSPQTSPTQNTIPKNPYKKSSSLPSKIPRNPYPQPQRKHSCNPFYSPSKPIPYRTSPSTTSPLPSANPFVTQKRSIPFKRTTNNTPKSSPTPKFNPTPYHQTFQTNHPTQQQKKTHSNPYLRKGLSIDKPIIRNPYIKKNPTESTTLPQNTSTTSPTNKPSPIPTTTPHKTHSPTTQSKLQKKTSDDSSSSIPSDNDMDIDSVISQLETDELSHDFSVHNKTKKKIKLTPLPKQINVNCYPINSSSPSPSSTSSSSTSSQPNQPNNIPIHSSTHSTVTNECTPPPIPLYSITNPSQHPETLQDLQHQHKHPIDTKLIKLYGDTVHRNIGTHLNGNIDNDSQWYYLWFQLISYHHPLYTPPQSKLGCDIIKTLSEEFQGVRNRQWNSEKALLFPIIILRKPHQKLTSQEIKHRLRFRLDQWKNGQFIALATDTITEAFQYHDSKPPVLAFDEKLHVFNQLVYHGKLREALQFLTNKHDENVILQPNDIDSKTGKSVL